MKYSVTILSGLLFIVSFIGCKDSPNEVGSNKEAIKSKSSSAPDSVISLEDLVKKTVSIYANGNIKEIGVVRAGIKDGIWRKYSEKGELTGLECFFNGDPLPILLDTSDYSYREYQADNLLSFRAPATWNQVHLDSSLISIRKEKSKEPYVPNIYVMEYPTDERVTNSRGSFQNFYLDILKKTRKDLQIENIHWHKNNVVSFRYFFKAEGLTIATVNIVFLMPDKFYIIYCSCHGGNKGYEYVPYFALFDEVLYSLKYKNVNLF